MKHKIKRFLPELPLPKSREESLQTPVKVNGIHWKSFEKGEIEWIELNRPMSLQFDLGISIFTPTKSGTLVLDIN